MEIASRRTSVLAVAGSAFLLALQSPLGLAPLGVVALLGSSCRLEKRPRGAETTGWPPQPSAFEVTGRVTDESERVVPDARVLLVGPASEAETAAPRRETRSDPAGRFTFEGLPRGRYSVLVEAVGLAPSDRPDVAIPGGPLVVRLAGQGRSLSGLVIYAGAPVAGARVRIGGGALARSTTSDDQGRFVFHGLGDGPYTLRATKGLLSSPILAEATTQDEAGGEPGRDAGPGAPPPLELAGGLGIAGSVVDDLGRPLARAEVRAEASPDDPLADTAATKADGRFQLGPLPPGRYRLVATAPGHLLRAPLTVTLATPGGQELVRQGASRPAALAPRIELVRSASAAGRVVDAHGVAVVGAQIRGGGGGADLTDLAVIFDPLPLAAEAAASLPGARHGGPGANKVVRSDAAGAFRLDDLLPGPIHLSITQAPFAPLETETTSLGPGEHRDLGLLTLRDSRGTAPTDAGAAPPATAAPSMPAQRPATLAGIARDSSKRPLSRARVRAWMATPGPSSSPVAATVTDAGGHFTLAHVPAAPLVVELDHPSYPVTLASATPGASLELIVPVAGGIDGELREHVTGAAVTRGTIDALGPGGQRATASTKKGAGAFRLTRLSPGHWTLTARAPGFRTEVRDVDVPESQFLGEASVRGLRIELDLER
jgi:hypothetical protein